MHVKYKIDVHNKDGQHSREFFYKVTINNCRKTWCIMELLSYFSN
jgi:hypothetical protein